MTSMRTLNRRLLRWRRYTRHWYRSPGHELPDGYWRAYDAVDDERYRRRRAPAIVTIDPKGLL